MIAEPFTLETEHTLPPIHFTAGETMTALRCDRLAQFGQSTLLLSVVGHASAIKGLTVALQQGIGNLKTNDVPDMPKFCVPWMEGYRISRHHLGLDAWHLVAVAESEKLMLAGDDATLWATLRHARFTTPMLREWMPWLRKELLLNKLLHRVPGHRTDCWWLTADSDALDKIVSAGLRRKSIVIV